MPRHVQACVAGYRHGQMRAGACRLGVKSWMGLVPERRPLPLPLLPHSPLMLYVSLRVFATPEQRIGRPVERQDFAKLTQRLVGVKLTPNVVDILFAVCADGEGKLDGHAFVKLMRARERMPGRKVRPGCWTAPGDAVRRGRGPDCCGGSLGALGWVGLWVPCGVARHRALCPNMISDAPAPAAASKGGCAVAPRAFEPFAITRPRSTATPAPPDRPPISRSRGSWGLCRGCLCASRTGGLPDAPRRVLWRGERRGARALVACQTQLAI
jgi:hypothetical protein